MSRLPYLGSPPAGCRAAQRRAEDPAAPWHFVRPALLALVLAGCAAAPRPRAALPADPEARLAAVAANEARIRTLRARFSSTTRAGSDERAADGVVLVAKPDRFRLRLMLPFGITVFDYVTVGDRSWMSLPLADSTQRPRPGNVAPFSRDDLAQAFLRGPAAFPGQCTPAALPTGDVWVSCREGGVVRRTLRIGREGIVEETSYDAEVPRLTIRYADDREIDGVTLPFHITLDSPQRRQSVEIRIERYEVNPTLADDLFLPPPHAVEDAAPAPDADRSGRGAPHRDPVAARRG